MLRLLRRSNQFPTRERPPLEESGSAVQKAHICPQKKQRAGLKDENIFLFLKSNPSFDTMTWNMRRLMIPAAAAATARTQETKAQEDKIQTVLL